MWVRKEGRFNFLWNRSFEFWHSVHCRCWRRPAVPCGDRRSQRKGHLAAVLRYGFVGTICWYSTGLVIERLQVKSWQKQQENFLLQSQLCVLTLIQCLFHPRVTTVARKRPWSFCQKYRWQVTAKHAYTLDPMKSELG